MTPRNFTEVALKILGIYSLVEAVVTISQGLGWHGVLGLFSKIEYLIPHVWPAIFLLTFAWIFLKFSPKIVRKIFGQDASSPSSSDYLFTEWHISLLSFAGGVLIVWGIPILLSSVSNSLSLLSIEPSRNQGFTRDSLLTQLEFLGGLTILEFGICMVLLFKAKLLTKFILKLQNEKST